MLYQVLAESVRVAFYLAYPSLPKRAAAFGLRIDGKIVCVGAVDEVGELGSLLSERWFRGFWSGSALMVEYGIKGIPSLACSTVVEKWTAGSAWRIGESNVRRARGDKYEDSILWLKKSMPWPGMTLLVVADMFR